VYLLRQVPGVLVVKGVPSAFVHIFPRMGCRFSVDVFLFSSEFLLER
jgi:hypothetical protein